MEAERAQLSTRSIPTPPIADSTPRGVWSTLARSCVPATTGDIWQHLADRLDPGTTAPTPAGSVLVRSLTGRDGKRYYVLRSPSWRYVRLDPDDFALWQRIDGRATVRDIAVAQFVERGEFVADRLARLIEVLRAGGFLDGPSIDCFAALRGRLKNSFVRRLGRQVAHLFTRPLAQFRDPDRLIDAAYRSVGWLFFTQVIQAIFLLIVGFGLAIWWYQFEIASHPLVKTRGSYGLGIIVLFALDGLGISLHNFAQGLAMKHHGRHIAGAGIILAGFVPAAYVETNDAWLAERRERLTISWAGPYAMLILSAALALLSLPLAGSELGSTFFKGATIWLANTVFNLLPIIDSAGYLMLVDYLEMPGLRARASAFIRHSLPGRIGTIWRLQGDERVYLLFGLATAATYLLIPLAILEARDLRYADALQQLWEHPEPGARVLTVIVALLFLGPAAVSLLHRLVGALRWLVAPYVRVWRARHGAAPAEHIELLASLPFLRGASRAELAQIALHLERREASAGTTVIYQGSAPDRFYLLLDGAMQVTRVTGDGRIEVLAQLVSGDYFGETALLAGVRRTANVTARTDVRLLSLRGGHVRRWIAGRPGVGEALRRSLAERDRLTALPLLQGLSGSEIDRLAARFLVTRYLPGDVIVRQGDRGDRFYIIVDGRVDVIRETAGEASLLATLGPGDVFGEMALLNRTPRSATVRALTAVETYTLSDTDFGELLRHRPAAESLRGIASRRFKANGTLNRRPAGPAG